MIESSFDILRVLKSRGLLEGKPSWWWEGAGSFEVVLGAILVQNTQWSKVEIMLDSMKKAGILNGDSQKDLLKLIPNILFYPFCIFSYCIHVVSSAPKVSIAILIFEVRMSLKYHQGTFSF